MRSRHSRSEKLLNFRVLPGETKFKLHYGDLTDSHSTNLVYIISVARPTEVYLYNFGTQVSFELVEYTVDTLGTLRLLDAIRTRGLEKVVHSEAPSCTARSSEWRRRSRRRCRCTCARL